MCYYVNISEDAVKIDSYKTTEFLFDVDFTPSIECSYTEICYDAFTSWYIQNNEQ